MHMVGGTMAVMLLAATTAGARAADRHPSWLVGQWAWINAGQPVDGDPCNSFGRITYHRDGRYDVMDESGVWSASTHRVTEMMLSAGGTGDPAWLRRRSSYPIRWLGRRRIEVGGANPGHFLRCGPDWPAAMAGPRPPRASRSRRSASGRAR